ncbi:MAG: ribonuclease HII [Candidatus Hydrothermarchaeaceae archaeon]
MICGIDEAGRGPVLGNLVVAGVLCREEDSGSLESIGVKDSKKLNGNRRAELYDELISQFEYHVLNILPCELDASNINRLEAAKFAEVINVLRPETAYVDCADVSPQNFEKYMRRGIDFECRLVVEHKADERYPVVSAASIIAKVVRDRYIEGLKEEYGDIGSGYPSDPKTIKFIEEWFQKHRSFPHFVRKKWKTLNRIKNVKLTDF